LIYSSGFHCAPPINVFPLNLLQQKRFQNDMSINNNMIDVLQDQKWVSIPWKKLQVGDIIKVSVQYAICFSAIFNFVLPMLQTKTYNLIGRVFIMVIDPMHINFHKMLVGYHVIGGCSPHNICS